MRAAGIRKFGADVEPLDLPAPRAPADDEVLVRVRAAGVGVWEDCVRTGGWDIGPRPPMALGVEGAGVIERVGRGVAGLAPGDWVLSYPLQLRHQGAWAELLLAPAALTVAKPPALSWSEAAALPVPGITAVQVVEGALEVRSGERVLVAGAGGVTGGALVQLAVVAGAEVFATASASSAPRVRSYGAREVIDYRDPHWPQRVRALTGGHGVDAAANAAPGAAAPALQAVRDGGRLVTITGDPPPSERGVAVADLVIEASQDDLCRAVALAGELRLRTPVAVELPLERAAEALSRAVAGVTGAVVVVMPQAGNPASSPRPNLRPGRA
jgi:NADPH:quinone reductase-like Zn-dependent oxidoreductase